jgi:hypothetical protein
MVAHGHGRRKRRLPIDREAEWVHRVNTPEAVDSRDLAAPTPTPDVTPEPRADDARHVFIDELPPDLRSNRLAAWANALGDWLTTMGVDERLAGPPPAKGENRPHGLLALACETFAAADLAGWAAYGALLELAAGEFDGVGPRPPRRAFAEVCEAAEAQHLSHPDDDLPAEEHVDLAVELWALYGADCFDLTDAALWDLYAFVNRCLYRYGEACGPTL